MPETSLRPVAVVPLIEGETVRLRPLREDDVPALVENCRDEQARRFVPVPLDYTEDDALTFLRRTVPDGWREGSGHVFAVADPADDVLLGTVGLHAFRATTADVGVNIGPAARGRGVGTAACRLLIDYAVEGLGLRTLYWQAFVGNVASLALARRLGFTLHAELPGFAALRGEPVDVWLLGLSARTGGPEPREKL
ncbi:acetyltransferase [Tersicoccus solisilvae]|uniref:Acetyltransferase n=1 Tax=Tersicoccus solisilvae TaxID=1882339 RepID=A0ABQ1PPW9_9MICC|nr:GNAT family protein [Tersicoccus solisilvae]GGD00821.1 acetyltransferase [Tersicoccus solisilvae]